MQIFKSNEFFCGLSIPDPGTIEPIEKKLPKEIAGVDGVDFMKVLILKDFFFKISFQFLQFFQKCLDKDPAKRYTCEQLLNHAFFKNFTFKFPETELEEFERLRRVRYQHRNPHEIKALVSVDVCMHFCCESSTISIVTLVEYE